MGILRNVRLDLRLTMAIGFTYVVACALISVLYVAALFSVNLVFQSNPLAISWAGSLVAVLPVVVLLGPLLHQVRRFADYWICRRRYEYLRALKVFNRYAKDISDLRLLALAVEQAITLGTGAEDVRLLVPTENGVWFTAVSDRIFNSSPPFQLHASSPIVTWLRFHDDALKKEELLGEPRYLPLSEKERAALESSRIQLFVPLKHREDLAGILALAGKRSEEPYSERDLSLLRTTTNQAAMWVSNARMFASVSSQRSRLENLLERAVQTQENERKRLAMELHDSPVQWLTSAVYHLEACLESFRRGEKRMTGRELQEVQETLNKSLEELRHTAAALYPPGLEKQGLLKTMGHYAERFERDSGIRTSFQPSGSVPRLSAQVELATYRVVQEALSNVRKHSQATEVQLQMGLHNGAVWASIRDNGTGFEVDDTGKAENGHLGLASMEERAHMLGGTLGVQSAPDFGTQITFLIPSVERNGSVHEGPEPDMGPEPTLSTGNRLEVRE